MRRFLLLCLLLPALAAASTPVTTPEQVVKAFVEAGNRQDVDAMLALVEEDVRWLHVAGEVVGVEVEGRYNLREWLGSYYASTPGAHSALGPVAFDGRWATTVETASWRKPDGTREALSSVSVYAFSERGRIAKVFYFPSQPAAAAAR